jgi:hypothetical protein
VLEADWNRADCNDRKGDGGGFDGVLKVEDLKGGEVSGFEGSGGGEGLAGETWLIIPSSF